MSNGSGWGPWSGPLRQRLIWEREVAEAPRTAAALGAALEAIGAPAFVVDARGYVLHLNRAGRAMRDRDQAGITRSLIARARRKARSALGALAVSR